LARIDAHRACVFGDFSKSVPPALAILPSTEKKIASARCVTEIFPRLPFGLQKWLRIIG
jgi:hypothetical protein